MGSYLLPVGGLADRFRPGVGGSLLLRARSGSPWWGGSLELSDFQRENAEGLVVTREVGAGASRERVTAHIPGLSLRLTIAGAAVQAGADLVDWGGFRASLAFSGGLYHWVSTRNAYIDTLVAETSSGTVVLEAVSVPENRQEDWSGGFSGGLEASLRLWGPLWATAGARYRIVVGELWPTLALDIENVSTMQMFDLRLSIGAEL